MTPVSFYGAGFPYRQVNDFPGKLIVLEGTDAVGRSTQITLLRRWLEDSGYAVSDTGLRRGALCGPGLDAAKEGHTLGPRTLSLFYATDFADRLENQIIPALKAGFIVLSDRYLYSVIARDMVRGADPGWARKVYGFALVPDLVLYLRADVPTLVSADNLYDSFCVYQARLIEQFDRMAAEFSFQTVDATRPVQTVNDELRRHIKTLFERENA
jgi:dTMP kinase